MPGRSDEGVWLWSEQFLEVLERWIENPPAEALAWNWPKRELRLTESGGKWKRRASCICGSVWRSYACCMPTGHRGGNA